MMKLDRIYTLDLRSLNFNVANQVEDAQAKSNTWTIDQWLDQGSEGACVGFAFAHELVAVPQEVDPVDNEYARGVYFDAQKIDQWAGGAYPGADPFYEGTSVLAGAKVCTNRGFYASYYWALNIKDLAIALGNYGPCVMGSYWFTGMDALDPNGFIHPTGSIRGAHAYLINSIHIVWSEASLWDKVFGRSKDWKYVNLDKSYVTIHNSWGQGWGNNGTAKISLNNLKYLLERYGDACFPERTSKTTA